MTDKYNDIHKAQEQLASLFARLKDSEECYDRALEHAANYLGNDDEIERIRDQKARVASNAVGEIRGAIKEQLSLIQSLTDKQ